ncbi:hypothetical protein BGZ95_000283 [Linnemannia exigua]|uniref:Yeast cell wall synthesis Kre9/Knh1-like N-terminal domain-containing protein n=1 Tax=Linnemannia exigua TaxID=604196 RepID=A0AAD4D8G7_9FUNG|nr:hypothetical protein BGZ95_000283 [Linnemannia exigua]
MKTTITSALFLLSASFISTATAFVYPNTPIGDTIWKPDSNVTISWRDDKQAPLLTSKPVFDIFLMTGADDKQKKLATIATNVNGGTTTSVKYHVPHVNPPGQIYFLMFQTKDGKGTAWATRFTITDSTGNPGTLKPVIPAGGKINPGGWGSIVATPVKHINAPAQPKPAPATVVAAASANSNVNVKAASVPVTAAGGVGKTKESADKAAAAGSSHEKSAAVRFAGSSMVTASVGAVVVGGLHLLGF